MLLLCSLQVEKEEEEEEEEEKEERRGGRERVRKERVR